VLPAVPEVSFFLWKSSWLERLVWWSVHAERNLLALETPQDENNIGAGFLFWIRELMMCCDHLSAGMVQLICPDLSIILHLCCDPDDSADLSAALSRCWACCLPDDALQPERQCREKEKERSELELDASNGDQSSQQTTMQPPPLLLNRTVRLLLLPPPPPLPPTVAPTKPLAPSSRGSRGKQQRRQRRH